MRNNNTLHAVSTLAALTFGIASFACASLAQGRFPQPRNNQGQRGDRGRHAAATTSATGTTAAGSMVSSGTAFNAGAPQMPVLVGVITNGNTNTGQLLIQPQSGGSGQVVQVTNSTLLMAQTTVPASSIQPGDMIQCQVNQSGSASSSSAGTTSGTTTSGTTAQSSTTRQNSSLRRPGFLTRGSTANTNSVYPGRVGVATAPQFTSVTGRITSTNPLMISTGGTGSASLNLPSNAPVTKFTQVAFSSLRPGDQVMVAGQMNSNGTFVAVRIAVNRNTISSAGGGG